MSKKEVFNLDARQQSAVDHTFGPLLVIAGAGSGKTRVLTERIARLVREKHALPSEILAVTFTNKAAKEMRKRIGKEVGAKESRKMTICTFHSLGVRILREFGQYIGLHADFKILSDNERISTLKTIMRSTSKTMAKENVNDFGNDISLAKNGDLSPKEFAEASPENRKVGRVFDAYTKVLLKRQSVDFDDLLLLPLKLFQTHPAVLEKFRSRYKFVSLDEFQDTNTVQLRLTRLLVAHHNNLMVVGDDDQGIYSWRGAEIENILHFAKINKNCKTVILNQNYRSTTQIVDGANGVVQKNIKRKEKDIVSAAGPGEPIVSYKAEDEESEVKWIVEQIYQYNKFDQFLYNQQAILFRTNAHMRRFEEELRSRRIPYVVQGGKSFFDRKEVKDIFAYLSFFANTHDELSLDRILKVPDKGIAASTMLKIEELAGDLKGTLWEAFQKHEKIVDLPDPQIERVVKLVTFLSKYHYLFHSQRPAVVTRAMLEELRYIDLVQKIYKEHKSLKGRMENIEEIFHALDLYERKRGDESTLTGFLQKMNLSSGEQESDKPRGVTLMSLHKSKGLEFPVVYMPLLDDAIMPSKQAREEGKTEEERRLFYVGMTRAKKQLYLTFPNTKLFRKRDVAVTPSRFLYEIPLECLDGKIGEKQDAEFEIFKKDFFKDMENRFSSKN